jgi:2-dehydropantoate 2-reductase
MERMRLLIVGGGGLGTVIAAYLAKSDVDVTLFVKPEQHRQFARPEVRLEGAVDLAVPLRVLSTPGDLGAVDFTLICVKAKDTEAALTALGPIQTGAIASLQNGVRKDELLVRRYGKGTVLGGLTYIAGALRQMGSARASNPGVTFFGELDGNVSTRTEAIAAAFRAAGLPAESVANVVALEWYKLAVFLRTALVSALTRLDIATLASQSSLCRVCAAIAWEVAHVAAAEGYLLPREAMGQFRLAAAHGAGHAADAVTAEPREFAEALAVLGAELRRTGRSFYPSLAQDSMQGRPTEIEATAGDALERAARHGLTLPVLESCTDLVRGLESSARS